MTAAFDSAAATYDQVWTNSPVGRAQRDLVWRHIDRIFQPHDRVLDLGCGTGEDAAHLESRGVTVHAVDPSPAMLAIAGRRVAKVSATLPEAPALFDGALSNFGALNCVEDLRASARDLATLVRPDGRVAICIIGRVCLWEAVYYCARLEFAKAFRRLRGIAPTSLGITVCYPTVSGLAEAFADGFTLERFTGIGLCVPPSYVRLPVAMVRICAAADRWLAHIPILRTLADHRLIFLVRK